MKVPKTDGAMTRNATQLTNGLHTWWTCYLLIEVPPSENLVVQKVKAKVIRSRDFNCNFLQVFCRWFWLLVVNFLTYMCAFFCISIQSYCVALRVWYNIMISAHLSLSPSIRMFHASALLNNN